MLIATTILTSVAAGFVAQLVDGSLGMGFGTITMTFLLGMGIAPAVASASVNVATIATGAVSAASHAKLGNVHWPTTLRLGIPGAIGGFGGAFALMSLTRLDAATPVTSAILVALGAAIVWRFAKGTGTPAGPVRSGFAAPTGLVGGFLAAVGGGGWGPVTMPVTLATSRLEPYRVVGSVSTSQVFASTAAVIGFWIAAPETLTVLWPLVAGMAVGGMAAAPLAAWLTRRIPTAKLGSTIGMLVVALNLRTFLGGFDLPWPVITTLYLALAATWAVVLVGPKREAALAEDEQTPAIPAQGPAPEAAPAKAEA